MPCNADGTRFNDWRTVEEAGPAAPQRPHGYVTPLKPLSQHRADEWRGLVAVLADLMRYDTKDTAVPPVDRYRGRRIAQQWAVELLAEGYPLGPTDDVDAPFTPPTGAAAWGIPPSAVNLGVLGKGA